ncbi:uncharacterized protein LOC144622442 [Crassostrea virginica]
MFSGDKDYEIKCCGFVSAWDFFVGVNTGTLYAQVWRRSVATGNWQLVNQNAITITITDQNKVKTVPIDPSQRIPVLPGDYIGFKSTAATLPMYHRTNMGIGSSSEDVIYSDTAYPTSPGSTDSSFVAYPVKSIEFNFLASLSPGIYSYKKRKKFNPSDTSCTFQSYRRCKEVTLNC